MALIANIVWGFLGKRMRITSVFFFLLLFMAAPALAQDQPQMPALPALEDTIFAPGAAGDIKMPPPSLNGNEAEDFKKKADSLARTPPPMQKIPNTLPSGTANSMPLIPPTGAAVNTPSAAPGAAKVGGEIEAEDILSEIREKARGRATSTAPSITSPRGRKEKQDIVPKDRFKTQYLPEVIYKKEYRKENQHLPRSINQDDLERMLFDTAGSGNVNGLRAILDMDVSPDPRNVYGNTPLLQAALHSRIDTLRLLLARGADPSIQNGLGLTALHMASQKGRPDIVKVLLHVGADPNIKDSYGNTPLQYAAAGKHFAVAQLLLDNGAKREARFLSELVQNKEMVGAVRRGKQGGFMEPEEDPLKINKPFVRPQPVVPKAPVQMLDKDSVMEKIPAEKPVMKKSSPVAPAVPVMKKPEPGQKPIPAPAPDPALVTKKPENITTPPLPAPPAVKQPEPMKKPSPAVPIAPKKDNKQSEKEAREASKRLLNIMEVTPKEKPAELSLPEAKKPAKADAVKAPEIPAFPSLAKPKPVAKPSMPKVQTPVVKKPAVPAFPKLTEPAPKKAAPVKPPLKLEVPQLPDLDEKKPAPLPQKNKDQIQKEMDLKALDEMFEEMESTPVESGKNLDLPQELR